MMKKEIITICGGLGSGKSSTAKLVAQMLGFKHFSSGDLFRQVGLELGLSINEINKKAETSPDIDYKTDEKLRDLRNAEKIVVDSRTAFHWIPESFKVYLDLDPKIAAGRMLNDMKNNPARHFENKREIESIEEMVEKSAKRLASERKRYFDLYGIEDHKNKKNFDLVVDTNKNNLNQVVNIIVSEYKKWLEKT